VLPLRRPGEAVRREDAAYQRGGGRARLLVMSIPDTVNGFFEFGMSAMLFRCIVRLWYEKKVRGWSMGAAAWPMAWGLWNLYYYPHLGQWFSFSGGLLVVIMNAVWLVLARRYER